MAICRGTLLRYLSNFFHVWMFFPPEERNADSREEAHHGAEERLETKR